MRKLLTIRWFGFHLLTFGSVALFIVLGHWQWDVGGTRRGNLRNYAYGVEWWVFAVILLVLWGRLIMAELKGSSAGSAAGAARTARASRSQAPRFRVPAPNVAAHVDDAEDPEMAAYNRYLTALHEQDLEPASGARAAAAEPAAGGGHERG